MKFYVAARLSNAGLQREVVERLVAAGHTLTYDWTSHGSVQARPDLWGVVAENEAYGVLQADFFVALLPGGQGTHVELGMAIASAVLRQTRVIVVGDDQDELGASYRCIFIDHPLVRRVKRLRADGSPRDLSEISSEIVQLVK